MVGLLMVGTIAFSTGGAGEADRKLSCEPDTILANDAVRIWFQGLDGHIKVFDQDAGDGAEGIYSYQTVAVVEVVAGEVVAEMDLSHARPYESLCHIFERDDGIELVYHVHAPVTGGPGETLGDAGVTFFYRLDDEAKGAKFDLLIRGWPWAADNSELAFDFQVHSPFGLDVAANGIGFQDRNGSKHGYIDWADNAEVTYEDEREDQASVHADVMKNTTNDATVRLRFTGVEAGYVELDYDPWVGTTGYDLIQGRIYGDDWIERRLPRPIRPAYQAVDDRLP